MRFTQRIYGLLFFASFFSSIATINKRSCCHISGLSLRSLFPLALMDFRVFSSLSSYRPRRPMRWTDSRKHRSGRFAIALKNAPQLRVTVIQP